MRLTLISKQLPEELLHNRSNLKDVLQYLNEGALTETESEELRKHAIDCELCGMWCEPSQICASNDGEEICENCKDQEEEE